MSEGCVFCDQSWMRAAEIFIETPHCIFAWTRDPDIRAQAGLAEGVRAVVAAADRPGPVRGDRRRLPIGGWGTRPDSMAKAPAGCVLPSGRLMCPDPPRDHSPACRPS